MLYEVITRSQRTTNRILVEARRLFAEYGFAGVSSEQIVTTAGVTRGALYHHFDGKKGLFRAVLNQVQTEIEKRVKIAVEQVQDPMEILIAGNNEFLAACLDPGLQRILLTEGVITSYSIHYTKLYDCSTAIFTRFSISVCT